MVLSGDDIEDEICPDLKSYLKQGSLKLGKHKESQRPIIGTEHGSKAVLDEKEYTVLVKHKALALFNGERTIAQVQEICQRKFGVAHGFVANLIWKLVEHGILEDNQALRLKPCIQWIEKPNGSWLLRNPEDMTYLEVDQAGREAIDHLGKLQPTRMMRRFNIPPEQLTALYTNLAKANMLQGFDRPPPKRKFTLFRLLVQRWTVIRNPDRWLLFLANQFWWVWTKPYFILLCCFLVASLLAGWNWQSELLQTGRQILEQQSSGFSLFFWIGALLILVVVPLHELAHALTLTHYGGVVPEIGVMLMLFIPTIYTNTTDSYQFVDQPRRRMSVVAAGVVCQLAIAASCLWIWKGSTPGSTLHTFSYLLGIAALFPIAVNTNPLTKFDGYYFLTAWTGIDNLRSRSIHFYQILLSGRIPKESWREGLCLAAYAPACVLHVLVVFGGLLLFIVQQAPITVLSLLLLWGLYRSFASLIDF